MLNLSSQPYVSVVQTWLLGFEFPSTFLIFEKQRLTILCSASKGMSI